MTVIYPTKFLKGDSESNARQRLKNAVDKWQGELRNTADAVDEFRETMERLKQSLAQLGDSCRDYQRVANNLGVEELRRKSRRLARIVSNSDARRN